MTTPLDVEVIVHAPPVFRHCRQCEVAWRETGFDRGVRADQLQGSLPEDLEREYAAVQDWVRGMLDTFGDRIAVRVIDATSLPGFWKALRHRLRRYPAIVVGGSERWVGTDLAAAEAFIARRVGAG